MNPVVFSEGNSKDFDDTLQTEMITPIKHFEKELASIRTGRATPNLVENIMIDAYGSKMRLKEAATISTPDARLLTIQPWDKSLTGSIEKALLVSDIGITPINDGKIIRLQLPMLSSQRREELVKQLGKKTEECRIGIRNVRKEFHNSLREAEKEKLISEDFAMNLNQLLQKITDKFIAKTDELHNKKAHELRNI